MNFDPPWFPFISFRGQFYIMGGLRKIGDIVFIDLSDLDSNVFLIGDTVIDSGTGFNFTRMYQALKILKLGFGGIKNIVNTHAHFDHIGGLAGLLWTMAKLSGASQPNGRSWLRRTPPSPKSMPPCATRW